MASSALSCTWTFLVCRLFVALLVLALAGSIQAQPLADLYQRALARNEAYLRAELVGQQANAALRAKAGEAWPVVTLTLGSSFIAQPGISGASSGQPDQNAALTFDRQMTLNVSQPIFQFGKHDAELNEEHWKVQAAWLALTQIELDQKRLILSAYVDALTAQQLIDIYRRQSDDLLNTLRLSRMQFDAGNLDAFAIVSAELQYGRSVKDLLSAEHQWALAVRNLAALTYQDTVAVGAEHVRDIWSFLPNQMNAALLFARDNNIEVLIAKTQWRASQYGMMAIARSTLPSLSWTASSTLGASDQQTFGVIGNADNRVSSRNSADSRLGFQLSVPIFNGGRALAQKETARLANQLALRALNLAIENTENDIRDRWLRIETESRYQDHLKHLAALEADKSAYMTTLLEAGRATVDDINATKLSRYALQIEIVQGTRTILQNKVDILYLLGLL